MSSNCWRQVGVDIAASGNQCPTALGSRPVDADASGKREQRLEICLALITARRLVGRHIGFELCADPVWDMLLDLYASDERGRDIAISSLATAANVPPTTALRAIKGMTELGLVSRQADSSDGRRIYIKLTPKSREALAAIFDAIAEGQ